MTYGVDAVSSEPVEHLDEEEAGKPSKERNVELVSEDGEGE